MRIPYTLLPLLLLGGCGSGDDSGGDSPYAPPVSIDCSTQSSFNNRLICYVNQARNSAQDCDNDGIRETPAVSLVAYNLLLQNAARSHSDNMLDKTFVGHFTDDLTTADPDTPEDSSDPNYLDSNGDGFNDYFTTGRVSAAGYSASKLRELVTYSLSAGSEQQVVTLWLSSPNDCTLLMSSGVSEVGGALAAQSDGLQTHNYWTLILAAPANP